MAGLMFFMEGLKLGLMPFGEAIGNKLPTKSPLVVVLLVAFALGVGVTYAEPAIGALKEAGKIVDVNKAPYLYALLNIYSDLLVVFVGIGVGIAAVLGTCRFIYNWSLKPMIYMTLGPTLLITAYIGFFDADLATTIGLAWDCGAVTTGPVTVPLVLALGIGVASAVGKGDSTLSGFGIVTLASLFPIMAVLGLSLYIRHTVSVDGILEMTAQLQGAAQAAGPSWLDKTPMLEIIGALRAIVPLVLFLVFVMTIILREKVRNAGIMTYGLTLTLLGFALFNVGLTYGLAKLGGSQET